VHLEASTKPHVHQKFEIFWTNIASTMACPMSKNGPKKGLRPLGVNYGYYGQLWTNWNNEGIGCQPIRNSSAHVNPQFTYY
jgi:hypothetical protein